MTPGAQAQVDWGDEGEILAHVGIDKVHSFHMVLSWSRDPFICLTTGADLVTFFDCHRRAFAHTPRARHRSRTASSAGVGTRIATVPDQGSG